MIRDHVKAGVTTVIGIVDGNDCRSSCMTPSLKARLAREDNASWLDIEIRSRR